MVIDVTDATFEAEVIERSAQLPVVVDLWAPWCGPCRTLGPILEKIIDETGGKVQLVKINVDENPQASGAFQVQSIPAVYALHDKKVVSGFIGAQPEHAVREFVQALLPSEQENEIVALIAAGDEASLRKALELDPGNEPAVVALGDLLATSGRAAEALQLIERIPESAETRRIAALARVGDEVSGQGDITSKLDALLDQVKEDDAARQEFVDLLELLGPTNPRTAEYRKQLTSRLF
jgi:putative thioredoxin